MSIPGSLDGFASGRTGNHLRRRDYELKCALLSVFYAETDEPQSASVEEAFLRGDRFSVRDALRNPALSDARGRRRHL